MAKRGRPRKEQGKPKLEKPKKKSISNEEIDESDDAVSDLLEGQILDFITNKPLPDSEKEKVRQRIARALFHEYAISPEDMEPDFKVQIDGRMKKMDIAIFEAHSEHKPENLRRAVVCLKEPNYGNKSAYKMRDPKEAEKEFEFLKEVMSSQKSCNYGLWTNGLEFFFFRKEEKRFDTIYHSIGDWPLADESVGTRDVASASHMRRADAWMLRTAFRRCHNYIHGNEGMPKDAAFWQFLFLIFAKLHDEKNRNNETRRFWAGPTELFAPEGQREIRKRIVPLFNEVRAEYKNIFRGNEEITLSDRALAFMVNELSKYDLGRTGIDAKGVAYQEIVGTNLRGDRGQYFTPRCAVNLMVEMIAPQAHHRILDPACGTGSFLVSVLEHLNKSFHEEGKVTEGAESTKDFLSIQGRLSQFTKSNLFGADFDQFLVKASQMNVVMASNAEANLFHMNSLEFPNGDLIGVEPARKKSQLGSMDLVFTNPPFGSDIPITDRKILSQFQLAHKWEKSGDGNYRNTGNLVSSMEPEVLFIERCVQWLKPGGRLAIVLPNGILGNPGDEYIRWWILQNCWVLASVEIPVEAFIVEANVNILTSLLFLKKKSEADIRSESLGQKKEYPVFMAVAEKIGVDRRGNTLYKRSPDGEEIVEEVTERESIRIGQKVVERVLQRKRKILDDDLPAIAIAYHDFRKKNPEPGR